MNNILQCYNKIIIDLSKLCQQAYINHLKLIIIHNILIE